MNAGAQAYGLRYQREGSALSSGMTLTTDDRRMAWECARDDAHLAFRLWCDAPLASKRDAYTAYRAAADREDVAISALMTT
jgi:hypothetical protein